ncbi:MAG TPA: BadF/BadG/BcrA/BcrD ATPase family protein, partial [Vitreimonas sp.]|nr:BadF/BadG/BcrA/BcrD ATPase family protein [Vitreimonas sp.]
MSAQLFLGVDGGGSRCRARLETAEGARLGEGLSGPATMRLGLDATLASIMDATRQALAQAGLDESVLARTYAGIGLAGTGHEGARAALESWRHPFAGAWFEGDGYLALLGAFGGGPGGVVIVGTGSIAVTHLGGKTVRIGGYGFPVSDEGGGAALGLAALQRALRSWDGRAEVSDFTREVLGRFPDPSAIASWIGEATATDYATFAPVVVKHAAAGDSDARELMNQSGARIAELAQALFMLGVRRVALWGGLAEHVAPYLPREVRERLSAPKADAMAGGILLAKKRLAAAQTPAE